MLAVLAWWSMSTLLGLAVYPLVRRLFSRLPSLGLAFARPVGILFAGYLFWLGANFNVIRNGLGGALLAVFAVALVAWWPDRYRFRVMLAWFEQQKRLLITTEIVFAVAFVAWAFIRANNPEITATEKPMELAFLNAILRSEQFPPRDPWLSGYAISYYYFGYVLLSFLTRLTGVLPGVAFNLGNSLWFALVALGSYGVVFDLLSAKFKEPKYSAALLGPVFVLLTGNLAGILEVLWSKQLLWQPGPDGVLQSPFWSWLGLADLENPPVQPATWMPYRFLWWWRGSRVIRDLNLVGVPIGNQSIDEFPFFTFLLADNHPHLLAMPFALTSLGFTLQVYFKGKWEEVTERRRIEPGLRGRLMALTAVGFLVLTVLRAVSAGQQELGAIEAVLFILKGFVLYAALFLALWAVLGALSGVLPLKLGRTEFLFAGFLYGSLAFLNTWDTPIYLSAMLAILLWFEIGRPFTRIIADLAPTIVGLVGLAVLFFMPWYPSFSSQAGGILPHLLSPTRPPHLIVMFAPLLVPIAIWVGYKVIRKRQPGEGLVLLGVGLGVPLLLLLLSWVLAAMLYFALDPGALSGVLDLLGVGSFAEAVRLTLQLRLGHSWTALLLGALLAAAWIVARRHMSSERTGDPSIFVLLLVALGTLLVLGPEFLYLKDQFGLRMNTIFKFYFAAWIVWGVAAAYFTALILAKEGWGWRAGQLAVLATLSLGLVYTPLAIWTKTNGFKPPFGRTLDGSLYPSYAQEGDREAIAWMNENLPVGVVAEAVGGSYTYYARVSAHTGFPTVIGWPGHEGQWRGGYGEQGSREQDVRVLYQTSDWDAARFILDHYGIDYVYLGDLERTSYAPVFEQKFDAFMDLVFENGSTKIYARRGGSGQ